MLFSALRFAFREDLSDSVSLSFHFAQGTRTLSDEAVAVYLSREIEGRLGDIEGIQVRRLLVDDPHRGHTYMY